MFEAVAKYAIASNTVKPLPEEEARCDRCGCDGCIARAHRLRRMDKGSIGAAATIDRTSVKVGAVFKEETCPGILNGNPKQTRSALVTSHWEVAALLPTQSIVDETL